MSKKLAGQVALVTGASKGIGASIAKHLAGEGAPVVVDYASRKEGAERVVLPPQFFFPQPVPRGLRAKRWSLPVGFAKRRGVRYSDLAHFDHLIWPPL